MNKTQAKQKAALIQTIDTLLNSCELLRRKDPSEHAHAFLINAPLRNELLRIRELLEDNTPRLMARSPVEKIRPTKWQAGAFRFRCLAIDLDAGRGKFKTTHTVSSIIWSVHARSSL